MKQNQLNKGQYSRVMYVENKDGDIDGISARIGWVKFSKTGKSVYYRGRTLCRGSGAGSNHFDEETGEEYWISGIKKRESNIHWAENTEVKIDKDALEEYERIKNNNGL